MFSLFELCRRVYIKLIFNIEMELNGSFNKICKIKIYTLHVKRKWIFGNKLIVYLEKL